MSDRPEPDIHQQTAFDEDGQLEVTHSTESDQSNLFAETADDQHTLSGDDAVMQCLFDE